MQQDTKTVLLPKPRGFCAGVIRAIDIVEIALERLGAPVYVRKEIVHNRFVVEDLASRGAIFVDSLTEVPDGAVTIFSAHGVAPDVREDAVRRKLRVIDATCPLVTKVHIEVVRYAQEGYSIVLIGHHNHDEVVGTYGEAPDHIHIVSTVEDVDALQVVDRNRIIYATQTTLSLDDTQSIVDRLKERFPSIISPASSDICYATQNRQIAVKTLAAEADLILVVGSENSSNSNRLVEVARGKDAVAHLIGSARDIRLEWLERCTTVGVTAGASTPEILVQEVVQELRELGFTNTRELDLIEENVHFPLPAPLEKFERVNF
ncbi:MAG TPA: 4-hydroxy-3-methylbut-2-enyl diphosphate reductase [Terriglobia bacterium]|jgi:4-hydroxy-3-methylbut-2-enyl diphosphate reductase